MAEFIDLTKPLYVVDQSWVVNNKKTHGLTKLLDQYFMMPVLKKGVYSTTFYRTGANILFITFYRLAYKAIRELMIATPHISKQQFIDTVVKVLYNHCECDLNVAASFATKWADSMTLQQAKVKKLWLESQIHCSLGNAVDRELKNYFKSGLQPQQKAGMAVVAELKKLHLTPVASGIRVTAYNRPTDHCIDCGQLQRDPVVSTEVDLIAWDEINKKVTLIELKTHKGIALDSKTARRYRYQAWLTWFMFSNTYPYLAYKTQMKLIIVSLVSRTVEVSNVKPCVITKRLYDFFPCLLNRCKQQQFALTPMPIQRKKRLFTSRKRPPPKSLSTTCKSSVSKKGCRLKTVLKS
uniref:Protein Allo60 n=1 Tax=Lake sturgeon herpesvirus TaxID=2922427 RepID=A0A9E9GIQ4_9VIRU|nr:protein Allo60 [Lake sturgeon herpesvirus]